MSGLCELIHRYCPEGGVVCDFMAGTLTVGMATLRMNRNALLGERDVACAEVPMISPLVIEHIL